MKEYDFKFTAQLLFLIYYSYYVQHFKWSSSNVAHISMQGTLRNVKKLAGGVLALCLNEGKFCDSSSGRLQWSVRHISHEQLDSGAGARGIKRALGHNRAPLAELAISTAFNKFTISSSYMVGALNTVADNISRNNLESLPVQVLDIQLQLMGQEPRGRFSGKIQGTALPDK